MIYISEDAYIEIINFFLDKSNEVGGILGGHSNYITHFEADEGISNTLNSYEPNIYLFNKIIKIWENKKISFLGLIHLHHRNPNLSQEDIDYCLRILNQNKQLEKILSALYVKRLNDLVLYEISRFKILQFKFQINQTN